MDGASPAQVLLGSARQDNLDLLTSTLSTHPDLLNTARDPLGLTPLHYAAKYGSLECLDYLLDQPVDIDAVDKMGRTALHLSVIERHTEVIEFLIDAGSDTGIKDKHGDSAMMLASAEIKELIEKNTVLGNMHDEVVDVDELED